MGKRSKDEYCKLNFSIKSDPKNAFWDYGAKFEQLRLYVMVDEESEELSIREVDVKINVRKLTSAEDITSPAPADLSNHAGALTNPASTLANPVDTSSASSTTHTISKTVSDDDVAGVSAETVNASTMASETDRDVSCVDC